MKGLPMMIAVQMRFNWCQLRFNWCQLRFNWCQLRFRSVWIVNVTASDKIEKGK